MPFGKKSGPDFPLVGFRQLEKIFAHAVHSLLFGFAPAGRWGWVAFIGAALLKGPICSTGEVVHLAESIQIIGPINRPDELTVTEHRVTRAFIGDGVAGSAGSDPAVRTGIRNNAVQLFHALTSFLFAWFPLL